MNFLHSTQPIDDDDENYDPDADYEIDSDDDSDDESDTEYENVYEDPPLKGDCCYCHAKNGMKYDGEGIYHCTKCNNGILATDYIKWYYGETQIFVDCDADTRPFDTTTYEKVYDTDGLGVRCETCVETNIMWNKRTRQYECPECKTIVSRDQFFRELNVKPYGEACLLCNRQMTACKRCNHGCHINKE